jgi:glycosyltransferase involved in cell wall biosynthesis
MKKVSTIKKERKLQNNVSPFVTIIIITYNVERTLPTVLASIAVQDYPKRRIEMLVVDGNSTDKTLSLIKKSKLPIRVVQSMYPKDPEASRGVGLKYAKGEIIAFIDADNYLPHKRWLTKMVTPFMLHPEIVGAETMRYAYRKNDTYLNRYFALLGSADPVGLYLGKADKLSYLFKKWNLYGKVLSSHKDYFLVKYDPKHFPTLGSNGFLARKKMLLKAKSDPKHYFHIDVPLDLALLGFSTYAVVRDSIIHDTATSLKLFLKKRAGYMQLHYQKRAPDRRYKVFDPSSKEDVIRLIVFIIFSLTIIQPLYIAIKGYFKKPDIAWFVHPIFCFSITCTYAWAVVKRVVKNNL